MPDLPADAITAASDWESGLNSEHGEVVAEECARIVHGLFVAESRPPLGDCEEIARAVILHAAPFLSSDARDEGRAEEREACAHLADDHWCDCAEDLAGLIRARSQP